MAQTNSTSLIAFFMVTIPFIFVEEAHGASRPLAGGCVPFNADETVQEVPPDNPHVQGDDHQSSRDSDPVLQALPQATEASVLDGAAEPSRGTKHVGGMAIFFQETQLTGAAAQVVELTPSATVRDLVTEVERLTGVPTAVSFGSQPLEDMDAALSDLQIGSESLVHTHPITKIKVQIEDFTVDGIYLPLDRLGVPTEDRVIEVRYHGVLCPATWLFDHLRDSLIRKIQDRQWDQALTEGFRRIDVGHEIDPEELHRRFDSALVRGDKFVFIETTVKNMLKPPSTSEYPEALECLHKHRIEMDRVQLEQMIAAVMSEDLHRITISCTIVD